MKTDMLCQCRCVHAIPVTFLLHTSSAPLTHERTGTEIGDAYPSADPTGNADNGIPICRRYLRRQESKEKQGET